MEQRPRKRCRNPRCNKGPNGRPAWIPDIRLKNRLEGCNLYCSHECYKQYTPRMHRFTLEARRLVGDPTYSFEIALRDVLQSAQSIRCAARTIGIYPELLRRWLEKWQIDPREFFPLKKHPFSKRVWSKLTDAERRIV